MPPFNRRPYSFGWAIHVPTILPTNSGSLGGFANALNAKPTDKIKAAANLKFAISFSFNLEAVQESVRERSDHEGSNANESKSRKQSVKRREKFCRGRMEWIDRTHAAQNHGRVQKRIDPAQASNVMVSEHTDGQSEADC